MKKVYINSIASVSAQKTFDNAEFLNDFIDHEGIEIPVVNPNYKDFIPPAAARRMAKGIKMSIVASKIALQEAELEAVDAIITGTGMGCLRDSEKFLSTLIDNDEQYLTPTSFIQSTHNTVGGQVALELQCKGYNFTYVHSSNSFESALVDAKMQLAANEENTILVGGVDEIGEHTFKLQELVGHVKVKPVKVSELLNSKTSGAVYGEGANFFVLSNEKQESSYAQLMAVKMYNTLPKEALSETIKAFLSANELQVEDIDLLVLGCNGDIEFDDYYDILGEGGFNETQQAYYKHISGEFNTASSFGFWLASKVLKLQTLPDLVKLNDIKSSDFKTVLLYNQYRGENHSFTLLKQC
ncbi:beta-ketoacyl synthase N-terminal-like domain-containing protein [Tamlana sp. 2_MG-2023]|uniref:beta-ketoacyl synthase chain length factor n=1 Tax=unclassified Tamlana TaxID=2614803 RepID=UPI0026E2E358|nr:MULTISPECIES: beta-ketoacyl synthase N-terminal-like domain-containing protein [unclassified Tamlana]MDO6758598.1 beta-ketoacyl synthase N-terminal-like domain-containing protein [Tamlana sp. 2_MG-2023]MDO6789297.1 beta-ketoacyl synthase N-terminal-like domain-containing protein [Tamlana sp. 1_MG-2023]